MRKLLIGLLYLLLANMGLAQTNLNAAFDSRTMDANDKRVLQAALSLEGSYNSLLDGAWGRGSAGALTKATGTTKPLWRQVAPLLETMMTEVETNGWRTYSPEFSTASVQAPMSLLQLQRPRRGLALVSPDRDLQVRFVPQNLGQALTLAASVGERHVGKGKLYQSLNGERLIVSARTERGGVYLRTAKANSGLMSILIEWTDAQAPRARMIIASINTGSQRDLTPTPGGALDQMLRAHRRPQQTAQPAPTLRNFEDPSSDGFWPQTRPRARPAPSRDQVLGNAFYVNNTDLVTAAATLRGCQTPVLDNGARLNVVTSDARQDIAVLTSSARSSDWIGIPRKFPQNGESMIVLGFGSANSAAPALSASYAFVQNRARRQDLQGKGFLTLSTDQAGLGSPLLSEDRRFAGLIIANPRAGASQFFASAEFLGTWLKQNRVLFAEPPAQALTEAQLKASVRQVYCSRR